ncbi:Nuclear division RFT1 protein [Phaffia rhodozyma]|uniref:Man(5)GlcNAc(2)-PP-dolichol translocation protein RFT1 n=1 Tax=Phaffia rhodozyma TaxID=264483 RepID=A0A0F7SQU1_PHARH|nr:Nuclear division RFT1 protein [Phaffia rhodozyma]
MSQKDTSVSVDDKRADSTIHDPSASREPLLSASLTSAKSLVLLQLLSRLITFTLNNALLRFASPEVFGTAAIQFDLVGSTLLFLSREGVRGALLRSGNASVKSENEAGSKIKEKDAIDKDKQTTDLSVNARQLSLNLSLIPLGLFILLGCTIVPTYIYSSSRLTTSQPFFLPSLLLHVAGYLIELLSEPYYVQLQTDLILGVRVRAEGSAVVAKAVVTFGSVWFLGERHALLAFGLGQLAYGGFILGVFVHHFGLRRAARMWIPKKVSGSLLGTYVYFDQSSFALAKAMTLQSVVKHFLTEGDRMVVSRISPLEDQGAYAIATNYGSLVARIVFQPVEETARLYFARSLSARNERGKPSESTSTSVSVSDSDVEIALTMLGTLLRLSAHLAVLLPALGPPFIPTVLSILLPSAKWSGERARTPGRLLAIYTIYLPLMSANGVLEAFFAATANARELGRQSRSMFAFSIVFLMFVGAYVRLGGGRPEEGLLWGNVVNMMCRIVFALDHATRWFRLRGEGKTDTLSPSGLMPGVKVILVAITTGLAVRLSERLLIAGQVQRSKLDLRSTCGHVLVGLAAGGSCVVACFFSERKSVVAALRTLKRRKID